MIYLWYTISGKLTMKHISIEQTFFFFLVAPCGLWVLVPQTRIEPRPPIVKVQSPNHWTTRELPIEQITLTSFSKLEIVPPRKPSLEECETVL